MEKNVLKTGKIINLAKSEVKGFAQMYQLLEQKVLLGGLSSSTLLNYGRCLAKISLHFKTPAHLLEEEQISGYLMDLVRSEHQPSKSYFKHTVYGMRFLYRMHDMEDRIIKLPTLKRVDKLPVVLSKEEIKIFVKSSRILKHKAMFCLLYSSGLRSQELRNLLLRDIDFDRMMIHIRQTKYNKDRYVPLSPLMARGLKQYIMAYNPKQYLFNGKETGSSMSARGVQWTVRETLKRSGIKKEVTAHTLRHSYATHLLEMGMNIDSVSKLLGHSHLNTTLVYLHVARLNQVELFSPFDRLYER